jgi:chemotaxis protein CheD
MNPVVVGVGDCRVSKDSDSVLVTYALGSCIAVMVHDALAGVGGMLHFMLPECGPANGQTEHNPYMFADTGVPLLFRNALQMGADKRRLVVTVAGGAQMVDPQGAFNIGKRNYMALRKILWKAGVLVKAEEVGGTASRTVRLEVDSGRVVLRLGDSSERELIAPAADWGQRRESGC